jgi:RNA polymerase sigma-70 factor, ECF subfamily
MNDQTAYELIQKIKTNQPEAFSEIYLFYYGRLANYVFRRVLNADDTKDILSNTFFKIIKSIKRFKPRRKNSFNGWIYRIATNEINIYFRNIQKYTFLPDKDIADCFHDEKEAEIFDELDKKLDQYKQFLALTQAIKKLSPLHQDLIHLKYFENLEYAEIAQALNIKENSLRVYLHRALKSLHAALKGQKIFSTLY